MGGGQKNLKRRAAAAGKGEGVDLRPGQSIMQVISLRGNNLIEVMDANGVKSLALFPAKFQKSLWIKNGGFLVVDESGREKALKSGSKVACMVTEVLYHGQVCVLQKSPEWPDIFRPKVLDEMDTEPLRRVSHMEDSSPSDDEDGLPPIEVNTNRSRPDKFESDSESEHSDFFFGSGHSDFPNVMTVTIDCGILNALVLMKVLILMASALGVPLHETADSVLHNVSKELRAKQQCIAEITEMIHVASLLHDDVLDDAKTRCGISSVNFVMGNKKAVLAGDFLLSRACVALASLKNTQIVSLIAIVVEHLVTGETMQMSVTFDQRCSMEHYLQKTYYKTASLIANSCKAIALLA